MTYNIFLVFNNRFGNQKIANIFFQIYDLIY